MSIGSAADQPARSLLQSKSVMPQFATDDGSVMLYEQGIMIVDALSTYVGAHGGTAAAARWRNARAARSILLT